MIDPDATHWHDLLLDLLHSSPASTSRQAAHLLRYFARAEDRDALEAILLDQARDPWVRVELLRALAERRIALRRPTLDALVTELVQASGPDAPRARRHGFADVHRIPDLIRLAEASGCREAIDPLAAMTVDRAESRAHLLDASELDAAAIGRATAVLDPDEIERAFAGRPAALAWAIEHLALPTGYLAARIDADRLERIARSALAAADARLRRGEHRVRYGEAVRALGALPHGARVLDHLLGEGDLAAPVSHACVLLRISLAPAPDFAALPREAVAGVLRSADRPPPARRALLTWALTSDDPAFRYAALRGLEVLDGALPADVVRPLRASPVPLLRSFALGAVAPEDPSAARALADEAISAPDVVLRAHALRGLRRLARRGDAYAALCGRALEHDLEVFDLYYAPVTMEAALGLARHPEVPRARALAALVRAGLELRNDDAGWAIDSAIGSWIDGDEVPEGSLVTCVYWPYLYPAHRNETTSARRA